MEKLEELKKFVEICHERGFELEISLNGIKQILIVDFNKEQLNYAFGKYYLKTFIDGLEFNKYGKFDETRQVFVFAPK
jgi:hypothetical protein